jgi:CRISPR-associated exonuclease Cas4
VTDLAVAAVGAALLLLVVASVWVLYRHHRDRRDGQLVSVDDGARSLPPLRSARWGLVGRPDELRRRGDGRVVPVEWKSRSAPARGPLYSHRVQLYAYCLLVEEAEGRSPPYGVLRYGDGTEFRLPWDDEARATVTGVLAASRRPYRGEATPTPGKCRGCRYRSACDARAA